MIEHTFEVIFHALRCVLPLFPRDFPLLHFSALALSAKFKTLETLYVSKIVCDGVPMA